MNIGKETEQILLSYLRRAHEANRITFEHTDTKNVLETLGLLEGGYLLNAGAALFCESGMNELQMAKFASNERLTFTDIRKFTGSIMTLKDKAEQYVIDAMDWRAEIVGLSRKEIPEIPIAAIREAIINSFGHKLFESGQANEIAVYKNRIEIYSPGEFPKNHTPESFITENKAPIRRNSLITRTLYYSQDMETFATGLKRIKKLCDDACCKVEFKTVQGGFVVCFYRKETNIHSKAPSDVLKPQSGALNGALGDVLNQKILDIIRNSPKITQSEMVEILNISRNTLQRHIKRLTEEEILERKGGKRFGYWEIKA